MRTQAWVWGLGGVVVAAGVWGAVWNSERLFMNEFNAGVHFYLTGNRTAAKEKLVNALHRKPSHAEGRRLLMKILVDDGIENYAKKEYAAAREALFEAGHLAPDGGIEQQAILELQRKISNTSGTSVVPADQWLQTLMEKKPAGSGRLMDDVIREWLQQSKADRAEFFKTLTVNQDQWLDRLGKERAAFRKALMSGGLFLGFLGLIMAAFLLRLYYAYRLHIQQASEVLSLKAGPVSRQELLPSGAEWRKIDAIEAELVNESDSTIAQTLLKSYLQGEDPWVRARAAKALYKLDPDIAIAELKSLVENDSAQVQLPGVWALSELGSAKGIDLLAPLLASSHKDIQQTVIRCLVQMENKKQVPDDVLIHVRRLLSEVRQTSEWII
jgi:hypothetical protein